MSVFYYHNNQVIAPWATDSKKKTNWLLIGGAVAALIGLVWWGYTWWLNHKIELATVVVCVDTDGDGKCDNRRGSGVIISPRGYILTTRDMVMADNGKAPARKIEVIFESGEKSNHRLEATLTAIGQPGATATTPRNNYAVLQVSTKTDLEYVELLDKRTYQREESVKSYGFPSADSAKSNDYGPQIKVLPGVLTSVNTSNDGGVTSLTQSSKLEEGMFGGPLIQGGKLAGINTQLGKPETVAIPMVLLLEDLKQYASAK